MNFLSHLAHEKLIQPHHLRAAIWFEELPATHPAHGQIAEQCTCISRWMPTVNVSPLKLLRSVCLEHRSCDNKPPVIGMLREALNACDRAMRHERVRE